MGQKVNPIGFRLGVHRTWDSRWYADKGYGESLHEDFRIRNFLESHLKAAGMDVEAVGVKSGIHGELYLNEELHMRWSVIPPEPEEENE